MEAENSGPLQEEPTAFRPDSNLTTQKSEKYITDKKLEPKRQNKSTFNRLEPGGTLILRVKLHTALAESAFGSIDNSYGSKSRLI